MRRCWLHGADAGSAEEKPQNNITQAFLDNLTKAKVKSEVELGG